MKKWLIGVDEAGRGPLAGPVAVGIAMVPIDFDWSLLPGVTDSKKLSEKKREEIFNAAKKLMRTQDIFVSVGQRSAQIIDTRGIAPAIREAMAQGLQSCLTRADVTPEAVRVLLDGSLYAPEQFVRQETIIKGDAKEPIIGLASIMAKVTRDRYMYRCAQKEVYTPYDFATHKGYGTQKHRAAIAQYGFSPEHRQSYCKNIKVL